MKNSRNHDSSDLHDGHESQVNNQKIINCPAKAGVQAEIGEYLKQLAQ